MKHIKNKPKQTNEATQILPWSIKETRRRYTNASSAIETEPLLRCAYKGEDDRIIFHLSHGVKVIKLKSVVIASSDIFIIYNFLKLVYSDLNELGFITNKRRSMDVLALYVIQVYLLLTL